MTLRKRKGQASGEPGKQGLRPDAAASAVLALFCPAPPASFPLPAMIAAWRPDMGRPDVIVLTTPSSLDELRRAVSPAVATLAPVLDLCGDAGCADWSAPEPSTAALVEGLSMLAGLIARWRAAPPELDMAHDPRRILLARLRLREAPLAPVRQVLSPRLWLHPVEQLFPSAMPAARALARTGHLRQRLVDRIRTCPACASARHTVREECAGCRSPDLAEHPILHHFRCGHHAPEADFRTRDDRLLCPKCRVFLDHFSVDYEKPGQLVICRSCGRTDGASAIRFCCLDCGAHHASERMRIRDVHAFELTELGCDAPLDGRVWSMDETGDADVAGHLRRFQTECAARGEQARLLMVRVGAREGAAAPEPQLLAATLAHLARLLRQTFARRCEILPHGQDFLALIAGEAPGAVLAALPEIERELRQCAGADLHLRFDLLDPDDVASMLSRENAARPAPPAQTSS